MDALEAGKLKKAAGLLSENMQLGRIPIVVIGAGVSAGVNAPTMHQINEYLRNEVQNAFRVFPAVSEQERLAKEIVSSLLEQLVAEKPMGWPKDLYGPEAPRSVQVRLYHLLQTSELPALRLVWQNFGPALLMRDMVKKKSLSTPVGATLADLPISRAHAWAACLALSGRALVTSLNYDGLTRRAVEDLAGHVMRSAPKDEKSGSERRTCRIVSTESEIRNFFTGIEQSGESREAPQNESKIPWRPVPIIKLRGDVFHAVCHNERCPQYKLSTPLYFVLPHPSKTESGNKVREAICCDCCRYPRRLEISFPGVFDKELQIDDALGGVHSFFGSNFAGVIFVGFSGSWDEPLVNYLMQRAKVLKAPVISLSLSETPALEEAAQRNGVGENYHHIFYSSGEWLAADSMTTDALLEELVSPCIEQSSRADVPIAVTSVEIRLSFPKDMLRSIINERELVVESTGAIRRQQTRISVLAEPDPAKTTPKDLRRAALSTFAFERLSACSQLGIKGYLLQGDNPGLHNRLNHSASVAAVGRIWYEFLRQDRRARNSWAATDEAGLALEMAVLYHDVRHLPFSHMMEEIFRELNWGHRPTLSAPSVHRYTTDDLPSFKDLEDPLASELSRLGLPSMPASDWWKKVKAIQDGRSGIPWLEAIVDSALDADKIEYLFNDPARTGQHVRLAEASNWFQSFLSGQSVTPEGLVRLEGESATAALELLRERVHLYRTLYLAPELRGLESIARYIVMTWLKWRIPDELNYDVLRGRKLTLDEDLRPEKSEAAGKLLWELFRSPKKNGKGVPANEMEGLAEMITHLNENEGRLDKASVAWINTLWEHLKPFVPDPNIPSSPGIHKARVAYERLCPRGPLYVHTRHEKAIRNIARRWRVHYSLLGLIDVAAYPSFLSTPADRQCRIGGSTLTAEQFLVPGTHPNQWRRSRKALTPLHQCNFEGFVEPALQIIVMDPYGYASGGGAFLFEMLRREMQKENITPYDSAELVKP